jgi:hypothetical protein
MERECTQESGDKKSGFACPEKETKQTCDKGS